MNAALLEKVASDWVRLGAMLNVQPAEETPDVEHLLLDTARVTSANSRLFVMAASWLARYGDYVAKHRLATSIRDELEAEHRPTLGFLLDWARSHGDVNTSHFNLAIDACGSAIDARPMFDVERRNVALARLARERASALSQSWGRWMQEFELKDDALRPEEWIARHNPVLAERALTGGDLIASVLAECQAHGGIIESEAELARRCGVSRPAIHGAIRRLRLAGRLHLAKRGRANGVTLCVHSATR